MFGSGVSLGQTRGLADGLADVYEDSGFEPCPKGPLQGCGNYLRSHYKIENE
jgi:hypothetical protein